MVWRSVHWLSCQRLGWLIGRTRGHYRYEDIRRIIHEWKDKHEGEEDEQATEGEAN